MIIPGGLGVHVGIPRSLGVATAHQQLRPAVKVALRKDRQPGWQPERSSYGSLIELTSRGAEPLKLLSGEERSFLEDGDTVTLTGYSEAPGKPRIGFGDVSGTILPSSK